MVIRKAVVKKRVASKKTSAYKGVAKKKVAKRVKFPTTGYFAPTDSQRKRISGKSSHRERVLMRATIRKAGVIPKDASNQVADNWLMDHGWLFQRGYQPPDNRVNKLAKSLRVRVPRNV